jgi:hypothetical protein
MSGSDDLDPGIDGVIDIHQITQLPANLNLKCITQSYSSLSTGNISTILIEYYTNLNRDLITTTSPSTSQQEETNLKLKKTTGFKSPTNALVILNATLQTADSEDGRFSETDSQSLTI